MVEYIDKLVGLIDGFKLNVVMVLIIANLLTGVAVSIKTGTFRLKELGNLMTTRIIPYVLGYLAVGVVAVIDGTWVVAVPVTWGIIVLTLAGAIIQNLKELGINLPDILGGRGSHVFMVGGQRTLYPLCLLTTKPNGKLPTPTLKNSTFLRKF